MGNWSGFDEDADGDGTADLAQRREHNAANELGAITAAVGADWVDSAHDAAGNMTAFAQPGAAGFELRARMRSTQRQGRPQAQNAGQRGRNAQHNHSPVRFLQNAWNRMTQVVRLSEGKGRGGNPPILDPLSTPPRFCTFASPPDFSILRFLFDRS